MTHKIGDGLVICVTPDETCDLCGKTAECRPYGPGGANVCFSCGMKNEEEAKKHFYDLIDGII